LTKYLLDILLPVLGPSLTQPGFFLVSNVYVRIQDVKVEGSPAELSYSVETVTQLLRLDDHDIDGELVHDPRERLCVEVRIERSNKDIVSQTSQITSSAVQTILRNDSYSWRFRLRRPENGGNGAETSCYPLIGPSPRFPTGRLLEQGSLRVLPDSLFEKDFEGIA
jgi:hypothetical protein